MKFILFLLVTLLGSSGLAGDIRLKALGEITGVARDTIGDINTNLAYLAFLNSYQFYGYMFPDLYLSKDYSTKYQVFRDDLSSPFFANYGYNYKNQRIKGYLFLPLPFRLGAVGAIMDQERSKSQYSYRNYYTRNMDYQYDASYQSRGNSNLTHQQLLYAISIFPWLGIAYGLQLEKDNSDYTFELQTYRKKDGEEYNFWRTYVRKIRRPQNGHRLAFLLRKDPMEGGVQFFTGKNRTEIRRDFREKWYQDDSLGAQEYTILETGDIRLSGIRGNWRYRWKKHWLISGRAIHNRFTETRHSNKFYQSPRSYYYYYYYHRPQAVIVPTTVNTRYSRRESHVRMGLQWQKSPKTKLFTALTWDQRRRTYYHHLEYDLSGIDTVKDYIRYATWEASREDTKWIAHLSMESRLSGSVQLWFGSRTIYLRTNTQRSSRYQRIETRREGNTSYNINNLYTEFYLGFNIEMTSWLTLETVLNFQQNWIFWYRYAPSPMDRRQEEPDYLGVDYYATNPEYYFSDNFPGEFSTPIDQANEPGSYFESVRRGYYEDYIVYPFWAPPRSIEVSLYLHL